MRNVVIVGELDNTASRKQLERLVRGTLRVNSQVVTFRNAHNPLYPGCSYWVSEEVADQSQVEVIMYDRYRPENWDIEIIGLNRGSKRPFVVCEPFGSRTISCGQFKRDHHHCVEMTLEKILRTHFIPAS